MAYTNTDTNMTGTSGLSVGMQEYYNRQLLEDMEPLLPGLAVGLIYLIPGQNISTD